MPPPIYSQGTALFVYNATRKWFTLGSFMTGPVTFVINAPFGRFTAADKHPKFLEFLVLDGIKSWMLMEIISPLAFLYCYITSPLSHTARSASLPSPFSPQGILASCYLLHYANRAILGPMRTPSRSKNHVVVIFSGVLFNILNGSLMGAYLSSPYGRIFLSSGYSFGRATFWVGLALWAAGFAGNIIHDEILLDIRRKANVKGRSKADSDDEGTESKNGKDDKGNKTAEKKPEAPKGEYYGIPQGLLYDYVSYPNYFCEWVEWTGFALAAAPLPFFLPAAISSLPSPLFSPLSFMFAVPGAIISVLLSLPSALLSVFSERTVTSLLHFVQDPPQFWAPNLAPPYIFLLNEICLMFPRAFNGHRWYRQRFGDRYPRNRKIVIPFLL